MKWIGVTAMVLTGIAVLGLRWPHTNRVTLPDGTRLTFYAATFGIGVPPAPRFRPPWLEDYAHYLPGFIQRLLPLPNPQTLTRGFFGDHWHPNVTIWFSHVSPHPGNPPPPVSDFWWQPIPGQPPVAQGWGRTQVLRRGDEDVYFHHFSLMNGDPKFGGYTNLFSTHERALRFAILDKDGNRLGLVEMPNPAYGQKLPDMSWPSW